MGLNAKILGVSTGIVMTLAAAATYFRYTNYQTTQKIKDIIQDTAQLTDSTKKGSWHTSPPKGYNAEFPIRSGGFDPEKWRPMPQTYSPLNLTENKRGRFPITLQQLLERERTNDNDTLLPELVRIFPENADPNSWKYIIVEGTAIGNNKDPTAEKDERGNPNTWCIPCNALTKEKTHERIAERVAQTPEVGLVKLLHPLSKRRPSYFDVEEYSFVPTLVAMRNDNGTLVVITPITAETTKGYATTAIDTINQLTKTGKVKEKEKLILTAEDFTRLPIHYEIISGNLADHLAITEAAALAHADMVFDPNSINYDPLAHEFIITTNLSDPRQFGFFLRTNNSERLGPSKGRNIANDMSSQIIAYGIDAQEANPVFKNVGEWINAQLAVNGEYPDATDYKERHGIAFKNLFNFQNGCVPPYISTPWQNFVAYAQSQFSGEANEYIILTDFNSPNIRKAFLSWAEQSGKNSREISLPKPEEIMSWQERYGLPFDEARAIADSVARTQAAYSFLERQEIEYARDVSRPVLEKLVNQRKYAIVQTGRESQEYDVQEIENFRQDPGFIEKSQSSLTTLMTARSQLQNGGDVTFLAFPYIQTGLCFTEIPDGSVTRFNDGSGGDPDTSSLVLYKNGRFFYTPFSIPTSQEATANIIQRIK